MPWVNYPQALRGSKIIEIFFPICDNVKKIISMAYLKIDIKMCTVLISLKLIKVLNMLVENLV